jgi:photosystem II stability/assembly factor-like uncharacterized protein
MYCKRLNIVKVQFSILFFLFTFIIIACCRDDDPVIEKGWHTIYQNDDLYLYSIKFIDSKNGYLYAGAPGTGLTNWLFLLSTSDGGNTWTQIASYPTIDIRDIFPLTKNVLLAIGFHVHRSNNNGRTWMDISSQFPDATSINDLHIFDSNTWLILYCDDIIKTTDAGLTWQTVFHTDSMIYFNRFSFPSKEVGYACIGTINEDVPFSLGLIVKTTNGGQSWAFLKPEPWKTNNVQIPYIYALQFVTDQIGYMATYDFKLYKTVDGGENWVLVHDDHHCYGLQHFITENMGYYTDGVTIYLTNNGGKSWEVDYSINTDNSDILSWTFLNTGAIYASTRDHKIIRKLK